jgi:hypothetical protein
MSLHYLDFRFNGFFPNFLISSFSEIHKNLSNTFFVSTAGVTIYQLANSNSISFFPGKLIFEIEGGKKIQ